MWYIHSEILKQHGRFTLSVVDFLLDAAFSLETCLANADFKTLPFLMKRWTISVLKRRLELWRSNYMQNCKINKELYVHLLTQVTHALTIITVIIVFIFHNDKSIKCNNNTNNSNNYSCWCRFIIKIYVHLIWNNFIKACSMPLIIFCEFWFYRSVIDLSI